MSDSMRNRHITSTGKGSVLTSAAEPVSGRAAAGASPVNKGLWASARSAYTTATLSDVKGARSKLYMHVNNKLGQLSFSFRVLYSMPQVVLASVMTLMVIYTPAFYENLGASAHYIAFFVAVTRSLDLLLDPFISYLSDSFRGPFGRRRPFIFVGCFLYALTIIMYLSPPSDLGELPLAIWFGVTATGFFIANSFTGIPYAALGMELASSYHDRTLLFYTSALCELLGSTLLIGLSQLLYSNSTSTSDCDNVTSCYSSSGTGESCFKKYSDSSRATFSIFDVFSSSTTPAAGTNLGYASNICTYSNGTLYANPEELFTPASCSELVPVDGESSLIPLTGVARWTDAQLATYADYSWRERTSQCLKTYCECVFNCNELCHLNSTRLQYSGMSVAAGMFFMAACWAVVYYTRERSQLYEENAKLPPPQSPLSAMLNTLRNTAFRKMLPTFVCDNLAYSVVTASMLYFVKFIIQPEMQSRAGGDMLDCNHGIAIPNHESESWRCDSNSVLGLILVVMLISGFLSSTVWYHCCIRYGKRNTWVVWSLVMIVALFSLFAVGKGEVDKALYLATLPGFALGARFIGMAILADVIEYDEYMSGTRNEASYVMIKAWFPKLAAIPANALPFVITKSIDAYSDQMKTAVYLMIVGVPVVLLLISIVYKLSMPLRYKEQCDLIADGIGLHMLGMESPDPITGKDYGLTEFTASERRKLDVLDHFPSMYDILGMRTALRAKKILVSVALLIERVRDQTVYIFMVFMASTTGVALTWSLFSSETLTVYPMLLSVISAVSLLLLFLSILRMRAAVKLKRRDYRVTAQFVEKVVKQREKFQQMAAADSVDIVGISEARRRLRMRLKSGLMLTTQEEDAILGKNVDEAEGAGTDSDIDDDPNDKRKRTGKKRGTMVVDHWKAIINMKSTQEVRQKKMQEDDEAARVGSSYQKRNFATTLRSLNDKIANAMPIIDDVIHTVNLADTKRSGYDHRGGPRKNVEYMTDDYHPTEWDLEFYSFVKAQENINGQRGLEETMADVEQSKNIGMDESDADSSNDSSSSSNSSSNDSDDGMSDKSNINKKKVPASGSDDAGSLKGSKFGPSLGLSSSAKSHARSGGVRFNMVANARGSSNESETDETDSD